MQDRPDAKNLLETARRLLLDELLPLLPQDRLYDSLMVARAMDIGARALAAGEEPLRREHAGLCALMGEPVEPGAAPNDRAALERAVERRNRALRRAIRAGEYDDMDRTRALRDHLLATVLDKVRETNPKYLKSLA